MSMQHELHVVTHLKLAGSRLQAKQQAFHSIFLRTGEFSDWKRGCRVT